MYGRSPGLATAASIALLCGCVGHIAGAPTPGADSGMLFDGGARDAPDATARADDAGARDEDASLPTSRDAGGETTDATVARDAALDASTAAALDAGPRPAGHDFYVRPSSMGSNDGTDWNNAWSVTSLAANMGRLGGGDRVWIAGGTYTTALAITASGTPANRLVFQRPRASDGAPTGAPGWSSSFDSQIAFTVSGAADTLSISGSYVTVDGRVDDGIQVTVPNVAGTPDGARMDGCQGSVLANVELVGPGRVVYAGYVEGFASAYGGGTGAAANTLTHCHIHGFNQNVSLYHSDGVVFDHCHISDCDGIMDTADWPHPNLIEYNSSQNLVIRYSVVERWAIVGIMMWNGAGRVCGALYLYGNVFKDAAQDLIWASRTGGDNRGPVYFYNNTVINTVISLGRGDASSTASLDARSRARNNVYWGSSAWAGPWHGIDSIQDRDYEFAATPLEAGYPTGAHVIVDGTDPFVSSAGGDYHLLSATGARLARNNGVAIPDSDDQTFGTDAEGVARGADGAWSIGAFE